jgi:hypothetical protein
VTYQSFAGAFANAPADDPVAAQMNKPAKVVVSKTLNDLEWKNSTLLTGDVVDEVTRLKDQPGAAILVTGSTTLARPGRSPTPASSTPVVGRSPWSPPPPSTSACAPETSSQPSSAPTAAG